jgi:nitrogen fixation/metabolism regulation signal transduction histidine kinase
VRLFSNPIFLHVAAILFFSSFAFLLGIVLMRMLRKSIQEEANVAPEAPGLESLPLHVYNTVIRQLKQQQDELKAQSQTDLQRSRTAERFTEAVLSNLSCGVLGIGRSGLVKSSNPAARQILGFASSAGMGVRDIFRDAILSEEPGADGNCPALVSEELDKMLQSSGVRREIRTEYQTPAGDHRSLSITFVPVLASDGSAGGAACLIHDITELSRLQQEIAGLQRPAQGCLEAARAAGSGI